MSSMKKNRKRGGEALGDRKASSLTPRDPAQRRRYEGDGRRITLKDARRELERRPTQIWVDLLLILLLLGAIAGGVFGYRILKKAYAPDGEYRDVVFLVEFSSVDAEILPKYWVLNSPVYFAGNAGDVADAHLFDPPDLYYNLPAESGEESAPPRKAFTVAMRTNQENLAYYRKGHGYFLGDEHLLAGSAIQLRVNGISANATIVAVFEADEYVAWVTEQSAQAAS